MSRVTCIYSLKFVKLGLTSGGLKQPYSTGIFSTRQNNTQSGKFYLETQGMNRREDIILWPETEMFRVDL